MAKYDYLIAGSGLFGAVFAHEMAKRGKKCLVLEKRSAAISAVRNAMASMCMYTVRISFIRITKRSGGM